MNLVDIDNLWGVACIAFMLWGYHHKQAIFTSQEVDNYKEMFFGALNEIREIKNSSTQ